jgi:hypothetical protein
MVFARSLAAAALLPLLAMSSANAHPGKLDGNGCHYETATGEYHCHKTVKPNRNVGAPVKKSRENLCHDKSSSNYSSLKYFVTYKSMAECLGSGGRAAG